MINKYWIKISYYIEKKNYVTSYISNTLYNNELSTKINGLSFFDIYKLTKEKKMNALYGINDDIKKNLLDLFLIINNQVFSKEYHFGTFFDFLEYNFKIIEQYFGISLKYIEIKNELYKIKKSQEETQKDYLFNKINKYIKNSNKKIYNIIISFYYIFIYECKDKYCK